MRASKRVIVVAVAGAGLLVTASAVAFNKTPPTAPITIKGCQDKKPPVVFDHPAHVKRIGKDGCKTCHHLIKDKLPPKNRCSECHATKQGDKIGTCKEMSPKTNPFHVRCRGCHQKMQAEHPKAPTACNGCHKK